MKNNKTKLKQFLKYFTLSFLFLMPIFDTTFFYSRVTTLIKVLFIFIILILTILASDGSRKNLKYLFGYYALCTGYLIISYFHAKGFFNPNPNITFNLFKEALTILKLTMPVTFIYALYYQKLTKKDYFFIVKSWILLIAGSIIILNIFKLSLSSYSSEIIKYNIFEWKNGLYYVYTASRGYFNYGNQETVILIMLLLLSTYETLYSKKRNIIYVILITVASLMLGTRVSSLGGIAVLIFSLIIYIIYSFIKKEKIRKNIILFIIPISLWVLLLFISPYQNRNVELKKVNELEINAVLESDNNKTVENEINDQNKIYIDKNVDKEKIPEVFYKDYYSYEYDSLFWYEFIKNTPNEMINYRLIETSIFKRIFEVDNRFTNILFGISNSRMQSAVNIERDFVCQYFAFGILGMLILLFIYPFLLLFKTKILISNFTYFNIIQVLIILVFCFISFLTGNIINSLTTIIPFSFILGFKNNNES